MKKISIAMVAGLLATLPQLLKDAGYHTYMVGKWHMGKAPDLIPAARGFGRDFSMLDGAWYYDGQASINGVSGEKLNNFGFGLTLGYTINDNLNLTVGYKSTVNDNAPGDLRMDSFMVTLVFGWHPLLEGAKRLKSE